jgi:hypothetical protein
MNNPMNNMNTNTNELITNLIVATGISFGIGLVVTAIPVCAQAAPAPTHAGGARFEFAPNYFKHEENNAPLPAAANKGTGGNGSVPKGGSSVLGISPKMLEKPTVVQTTVAATPSFTQPAPATPPVNTPAASNFGKPAAATPAVAQAKAGNFGKPVSAKPSSLNSDKEVSGKLLHHPMHYKVPAKGLAATPKALDSYGNGMGYAPGPIVQPTTPGASTTQDVYGKLLRK